MSNNQRRAFLRPIGRRINDIGSLAFRRGLDAMIEQDSGAMMNGEVIESLYDDDNLAPVMPAIDALQQLMEEERKTKSSRREEISRRKNPAFNHAEDATKTEENNSLGESAINQPSFEAKPSDVSASNVDTTRKIEGPSPSTSASTSYQTPELKLNHTQRTRESHSFDTREEGELPLTRNNPLNSLIGQQECKRHDEYEFIPKSVILDVYSNDPEVKRFLKQLPNIGTEYGYNEQDYKCYSCRRPIGMVFGQSRLCHFDGHHYCFDCHLGEKAIVPARILCNWDFNKYPISKRNQHFLNLISNEPMFELKTMAPLLYKTCAELKEIEELRCQAFFIRSYCFTCVQDSISFELTKLVWPREHLIKQIDLYSIDDFIQIKSGALKGVLRNVITFGRQHVLSCMLCCQRGFICELCKSSQIIYPFDTESVHRCDSCQSIYHKTCFKSLPDVESCPRCLRLRARRNEQ